MGQFNRSIFTNLVLAIGLSVLLASGAKDVAAEELTVASRMIKDQKSVFATIQSTDQTIARARIGGTVVELGVDEGSAVEAGEVIGRVEDPKLALELRAMASRIASASAQMDLARIELERSRKLRQKGTVSQSRLDEAETALEVLRRDLSAARAERAVIAERQAEGTVKAPTSGRVLRVDVTKGKVVLPGESIAMIAANAYVLRLQVPERHARFINIGDPVSVGARGMAATAPAGGKSRTGTVIKVYPEIRQGRVSADVELGDLGDFFVGERVRVMVAAGERRAFVVPKAFLSRRYGLMFVRLKGVGETVVQPGLNINGGIEILSGLTDGDILVRGAP
jgi:membrane fusion protein, multidrug efflux system